MGVVCECSGVTERKVRKVIARGARDIPSITKACRAGSCCGDCHAELQRLLAEVAGVSVQPPVVQPLPR